MKVKIFGREPAALVALIEATIVLLVANGLDWSQEQTGVVMAFVMAALGLYTAYVTKDTLLGVTVGLVKAVLTLLLTFGVEMSAENMAAIIGFVTVVMGGYNRSQTSPVVDPSFSEPPVKAVAA